jgi:hypothetical protein
VLESGERYPGDAGVLAALLLNRLSQRRGHLFGRRQPAYLSPRRRLGAMIIDQQTAEKQAPLDVMKGRGLRSS